MSDESNKKTLSLSKTPTTDPLASQVRQKMSHGRSKNVQVEVKRKRIINPGENRVAGDKNLPYGLTATEWESRLRVLQEAKERAVKDAKRKEQEQILRQTQEQKILEEKAQREQMTQKSQEIIATAEANTAAAAKEAAAQKEEQKTAVAAKIAATAAPTSSAVSPRAKPKPTKPLETPAAGAVIEGVFELTKALDKTSHDPHRRVESTDSDESREKVVAKTKKVVEDRRKSRLTVQDALLAEETDDGGPKRSDAAIRRARAKERAKNQQQDGDSKKVIREVILPETITVQDLAARMASRGVDVIKSLMKMGMMVTPEQLIDADTAELVIQEFGHQVKRVADSDVEEGLCGSADAVETLVSRPPVVTIMGHVDHGKTSLLDALRKTDVVSHEAGGITQHIGAYQVQLPAGDKITFIDTPGHAAFTEMRARGAKITDIVVLVVAADDGIKEQTIEAINHIKAANVPMVVAINKIDRPAADIERVKQELLQHSVVTEDFGGDILCVPVSAKLGTNLDKLTEVILLQSEMLDLKANPDREAHGVVVESKMEKGRGCVATILIEKGTLRIGDYFIVGNEFGKVRALYNDKGENIKQAIPSLPVEVIGLNAAPLAGDKLIVVENEAKAKEISEYRQHKTKSLILAKAKKTQLEDMFSKAEDGVKKFAVVIKADTHGSIEALQNSFKKLENEEVKVSILHTGVSGITESDVILANASGGCIIGFNVRANAQARDLAEKKDVAIKYYSIIYDAIDEIRAQLTGLLKPELREKYLGKASVRQVFSIDKVGKIAGCMVTEGMVQRGARVRLVRNEMVIHEGSLKTLKRFKEEVKEAKEGYECGMAFEGYQDVKEGDTIECFIVEEIARTLK